LPFWKEALFLHQCEREDTVFMSFAGNQSHRSESQFPVEAIVSCSILGAAVLLTTIIAAVYLFNMSKWNLRFRTMKNQRLSSQFNPNSTTSNDHKVQDTSI